jgi:hypothetical protein
MEPTTSLNRQPLTDLTKTTIYFDLGEGLVRAKDVPASRTTGGGKISESIIIPLAQRKEAVVAVCMTASDRRGSEGPPTR